MVVEVVVTDIAELMALCPVISSVLGLKLKVAGLVAPFGPPIKTALKATLPEKPFNGVTPTPTVLPVVAPATTVRAVGLMLRLNPVVGFVAPVTSA